LTGPALGVVLFVIAGAYKGQMVFEEISMVEKECGL
jgi:hypothetical protein